MNSFLFSTVPTLLHVLSSMLSITRPSAQCLNMEPLDRVHLREASSSGYPQGDIIEALRFRDNPFPFRTFLRIVLNLSDMFGPYNLLGHNSYAFSDAIMRSVEEYTRADSTLFNTPALITTPSHTLSSHVGSISSLLMDPLSLDAIRESITGPVLQTGGSGGQGGAPGGS
jgi:hypothetical protein